MSKLYVKEAGFTLVEVIVVTAMIGLVILIAIPNVNEFLQNSTTRSVARELYNQFQRAKLEAAKRNQNVAIVITTTGTDQYQLYVDTDADGTLDADEAIISTTVMPAQHTLTPNASMTGNTFGFDSRGRPYWPSPWPTPPAPDPQVVVTNTKTARTFTLTAAVAGAVNLQ